MEWSEVARETGSSPRDVGPGVVQLKGPCSETVVLLFSLMVNLSGYNDVWLRLLSNCW